MTELQHRNDLLGTLARHPVAANLVMLILLALGALALPQLNTQFFPEFDMELVSVRVVWAGATPEDVERSITKPLEQELKSVDALKRMTSTSSQGASLVMLEFPEGTDMGQATRRVEEKVNAVRNLPQEAEKPVISHVINYEPIARILIQGAKDKREARQLARRAERELLARGVAKVDITGMPDEELDIQIPMAQLNSLGLSLAQVANKVNGASQDVPAGTVGKYDVGRQMRALAQQRDEQGFSELPLVTGTDGRLLRLGDVASIEQRARPNQITISHQDLPAVQIQASRSKSSDSLKSAEIVSKWVEETQPSLPPNIKLTLYDEGWKLIEDRINLLLKNAVSGLLLVVLLLLLFLNMKVAWWVTAGIPTAFMATLALMWLAGGSINMISLFGMIMALGIIVDDAIVVGEDALAHYHAGERSLQAAEGGARRMLWPVMASTLTTVAAFIPLIMVSGTIGKILGDIPFVVICALVGSLIECFLVLPGHLRSSFHRMHHAQPSALRQRLDDGFARFQQRWFKPFVAMAVRHWGVTLASAVAVLILSVGLVAGGRLGFTFFPNVEGNIIYASASFVTGTPPERVETFINQVEQALYQTERDFSGNLVQIAVVSKGLGVFSNATQARTGDQFATVTAELTPSDERNVRNEEFLKHWRSLLKDPPGLDNLTMTARRGGHPGRDLEVKLTGDDPEVLKRAGLDLASTLATITGISGIEDDMPWGHQQLIYELTPLGHSYGLTTAEVGQQLRGLLDGHLAQIYIDGEEEVEVRVMLPDSERHHLSTLESIMLTLPGGGSMPLSSAVQLRERRGFEILRHYNGELALTLYADVNRALNNANKIRTQLEQEVFPQLIAKHGVHWSYTGQAEDQGDTLADMKRGGLFALAMIYIVLAWIFGSYGWPLIVMAIIPFGIVGAIVGHWLMGIELTVLSLFGLFGLSGIVVNDAIILVMFYKELKQKGGASQEAIVEAASLRLRAVLLTTLTTIGGLVPLMFETSLQAQFLIPMATSISFGLGFATFIVLLLVPAMLALFERNQTAQETLKTGN